MVSVSSSAVKLLIRDGKSVASLLFRGRAANLTENTGPAIRSLLLLNQTLPSQYPVFSETYPVMRSGLRSCLIQEVEFVSERRGKMEAGQGKRVVNNEGSSSEEEEEETDFDEEEFDDIDMDDDDVEFDDSSEDEDDDDDDDKEEQNVIKKK